MILQYSGIEGFEWIVGLGLMFGLAIVMTLFTQRYSVSFPIWLFIFNGFVVAGGLLPLWTLILTLIVFVVSIYLDIKSRYGGGIS